MNQKPKDTILIIDTIQAVDTTQTDRLIRSRGLADKLVTTSEYAVSHIKENMTKFVELLVPNSDVGKVPNSRAKAEIWSETEEFGAAVSSLETAAMQLSKIGQGASIDRFKEEFDALASACVVCHGLRPSSGGRFRSPKDG